jgi:hypothetical protein
MKQLWRRVDSDRQGSRKLEVAFVPQDCWIGVYWKRDEYGSSNWRTARLRVYVCILPTLPLIFTRERDR